MVWVVVTNGYSDGPFITKRMHTTYRRIQIFLDYVQRITHQTRIKLSLQVQNARNRENVNQCNICRACPIGEKPNTY